MNNRLRSLRSARECLIFLCIQLSMDDYLNFTGTRRTGINQKGASSSSGAGL